MRRGFAAALVVCLVAMSSWASACDLSCSVERFHSVCKLDQTAAFEPMASGMDMTRMDMPEHSASAHPESSGSVHLHANSCTHSACNETSISATSKSAPQSAPVLALTTSERLVTSAITAQVSWSTPEREAPDLQPFNSLSVSLRI